MSPGDASFSVVVPFYNEEDNVRSVLEELRATLPRAEIVAIDDGSSDRTWRAVSEMTGIRGLRFAENLGQSAAIYHGLHACTGAVCGLMDGDGQNDPASFWPLLDAFHGGGVDVVCGYREDRHDAWNRKAASRIANAIRRAFLHDGIRDTGCSQKVFPRQAVDLLVPFRGLHRYLPAIFRQAGLRLAEVPVRHRPRFAGTSKYNNWSRARAGAFDLIGVAWLLRRQLPRARVQATK